MPPRRMWRPAARDAGIRGARYPWRPASVAGCGGMAELTFRAARSLAEGLRRREFSARELLDEHLDRIERVNPAINAIVTLDVEGARRAAAEADRALAAGDPVGP